MPTDSQKYSERIHKLIKLASGKAPLKQLVVMIDATERFLMHEMDNRDKVLKKQIRNLTKRIEILEKHRTRP